jgi:hypothetical protein
MRFPLVSILALLSATLSFSCSQALADDVYTVIVKKQEEKKLKRWSLSEWLETKEKMKLMDMWLALHTPSPFEFFINGEYQSPSQGYALGMAAYASIVGLEVQREWISPPRTHALFHLRIFGFADQSTHITLQTGIRDEARGDGAQPRSALFGARMSVYLLKYFGVEGLYRHYFETAGRASERRWEAGAFIDFNFVRVYGKYFNESSPLDHRQGPAIGMKFYF